MREHITSGSEWGHPQCQSGQLHLPPGKSRDFWFVPIHWWQPSLENVTLLTTTVQLTSSADSHRPRENCTKERRIDSSHKLAKVSSIRNGKAVMRLTCASVTILTSLFLLRELRGSELRTEFSWNRRLRSCRNVTERSSKAEFAFPTMYTLCKKNPKVSAVSYRVSPMYHGIVHKTGFEFSLTNESYFLKAS